MIDHKHKCIFLHIPKNGGTSLINAFGMKWGTPDADAQFLSNGIADNIIDYKKYKDNYSDYTLFTIARNPWDRFVSGWKYCPSTRNRTLEDVLTNLPRHNLTQPLNHHTNHDWIHLTRTQHSFIHKDGILVPKVIIRFENLQKDFDTFCDLIGKEHVQFPKLNSTNHGHYKQYFTKDKYLDLFNKHYKLDIETFKYQF